LSGVHQLVSKKRFAGSPDDPSHGPSIKRNGPATTDDTTKIILFHTGLPKEHDLDADTEVSVPLYVPEYQQGHTYSIVVDLGTGVPSQVHFGVADGQFSDNSGEYEITIYQLESELPVDIDIKPGSFPNSINPNAGGVIPVAILGSDTFDASWVDPGTVTLEGSCAKGKGKSGNFGSLEDVNGDGYLDLVVQIVNDITWAPDATEATLTGNLKTEFGGCLIVGTDSVNIVPPN
jgi:hypothetical protein